MKYCGTIEDKSWHDALKDMRGKIGIFYSFPKYSQSGICGNKIKYSSEQDAANTFKSFKKKRQLTSTGNVYFCPFCSCWHIGKKKLNRRYSEGKK